MSERGLFVVIEGSDGSGKNTQFNLLKERLKATGYEVAVFDFPQYAAPSSYFVKQYLAGAYGEATKLSPYTASLFYALDRFEAAKDIKKALNQGKIVLSNRYVGSNMAHQGAKFDDPAEQRGFFVWEDNLEFQLLGIPRPDVSFFLRVPAEISKKLLEQRASQAKSKLDGHEADLGFLKKSLTTYDVLCRLFPKDFKAIECTKNGNLQTVAQINNIIWDRLKPLLPKDKQHPSHSVVVTLGTVADQTEQPGGESPDELEHTFNKVSLLLSLYLQRAGVTINPQFKNWEETDNNFYTPPGLPKDIVVKYKAVNDQLSQSHQQLRQRLLKYMEVHMLGDQTSRQPKSITELLLPLTPLSASRSFSFKLKKNDITPVASRLLAGDTAELQWAAQQLYLTARQKWPRDFDQPLESRDGPVSLNKIIAKLAEDRLPQQFSASDPIKLLEARPRLEFNLLAESIYPYSSLSLDQIVEEVSAWPYLQKYDSLKQAAAQPEVLKKVRYKLDVVSDQVTLDEIAAAGQLKEIQIQAFTPRYGYDVPDIIETAGLDDLYDACFDDSLKLYSLLQGIDREDLAPYATLLGHRVRWQLNLNAAELKRIIEADSLSNSKVIDAISERIAEVHPLLWDIIRGAAASVQSQPNGKNRVKSYRRSSKKPRPKKL